MQGKRHSAHWQFSPMVGQHPLLHPSWPARFCASTSYSENAASAGSGLRKKHARIWQTMQSIQAFYQQSQVLMLCARMYCTSDSQRTRRWCLMPAACPSSVSWLVHVTLHSLQTPWRLLRQKFIRRLCSRGRTRWTLLPLLLLVEKALAGITARLCGALGILFVLSHTAGVALPAHTPVRFRSAYCHSHHQQQQSVCSSP